LYEVELVDCDSDFLVRGCSVCTRKQDKLYVGECMSLTIDLRRVFGLCTFDSPYNLGGNGFVGFNVDLVLWECCFFSIKILMFCISCRTRSKQ